MDACNKWSSRQEQWRIRTKERSTVLTPQIRIPLDTLVLHVATRGQIMKSNLTEPLIITNKYPDVPEDHVLLFLSSHGLRCFRLFHRFAASVVVDLYVRMIRTATFASPNETALT